LDKDDDAKLFASDKAKLFAKLSKILAWHLQRYFGINDDALEKSYRGKSLQNISIIIEKYYHNIFEFYGSDIYFMKLFDERLINDEIRNHPFLKDIDVKNKSAGQSNAKDWCKTINNRIQTSKDEFFKDALSDYMEWNARQKQQKKSKGDQHDK